LRGFFYLFFFVRFSATVYTYLSNKNSFSSILLSYFPELGGTIYLMVSRALKLDKNITFSSEAL
jgi:hypothetical protein